MHEKFAYTELNILMLVMFFAVTMASYSWAGESTGLRLAVFDIDATPPIGSYLAYDEVVNTWDMNLRARC